MTHLIIAGVAIAVGCMIIGIMIGLEIGDKRYEKTTYILGNLSGMYLFGMSNWDEED